MAWVLNTRVKVVAELDWTSGWSTLGSVLGTSRSHRNLVDLGAEAHYCTYLNREHANSLGLHRRIHTQQHDYLTATHTAAAPSFALRLL